MEEGSFYLYVENQTAGGRFLSALTRKLSGGARSGRAAAGIQRRIDAALGRAPSGGAAPPAGGAASPPPGEEALLAGSPLLCAPLAPSEYVYPGAGLTVRRGLHEVAAGLTRITPHVYASGDAVIVFTGFLSNLSELLRGVRGQLDAALLASVNGGGAVGSPTASLERNRDLGALTAGVVLQMHANCKEGQELIFLSELQGQYAFAIYDNDRGSVFAARDPSSDERLYYFLGADGGAISLASAPLDTAEAAAHEWAELPPGHYVAGRPPRVQQFALTPAELRDREVAEHLEDSLSLSSSLEDEGLGLAAALAARRRRSGSRERTKPARGSPAARARLRSGASGGADPLFPLEL